MPRLLSQIDAEIAVVAARLVGLRLERLVAMEDRRVAIVADFDAGMSRPAVCDKHEITYATLSAILTKAHRTKRTQAAHGLGGKQLVSFNRLVAHGIRPLVARQIATAGP